MLFAPRPATSQPITLNPFWMGGVGSPAGLPAGIDSSALLPSGSDPSTLIPASMTGGDPSAAPAAAPIDWLSRLMGGSDPTFANLLSPSDVRGARNAALFRTGLAMLANSGPSPYRRSLGDILANSLLSGQNAFQGEAQKDIANRSAVLQQNHLARAADIARRYTGQPMTPELMHGLLRDLLANDQFQSAGPLSNYLDSQGGGVNGVQVKSVNKKGMPGYLDSVPEGTDITLLTDPRDGHVITSFPVAATPLSDYQRMEMDNYNQNRMQRERNNFLQNSPYSANSVRNYNQANKVLALAREGLPEATNTALVNFASVADPRAQIRLGMLHYMEQVDPSIQGKMQIFFEKAAKGVYPKSILDGLQTVIDNIHQDAASKYEGARKAELQRHAKWGPDYESYLPTAKQLYYPDSAEPSASGGSTTAAPGAFGDMTNYLGQ